MAAVSHLSTDFICCSLCGGVFTDPRALPCLHTFCARCLGTYITSFGDRSRGHFSCPLCRKVVQPKNPALALGEWAESFPHNRFVQSLRSTPSVGDGVPYRVVGNEIYQGGRAYLVDGTATPSLTDRRVTKTLHLENNTTTTATVQALNPGVRLSSRTTVSREPEDPDSEVERVIGRERLPGGDEVGSVLMEEEKGRRDLQVSLVQEFIANVPGMEVAGQPCSIAVVADGFILVADSANGNVKKFSRDGRLVDLFKLSSQPIDMAPISDTQVAVVLEQSSEINFVSFDPPMAVTGRLVTERRYRRIAPGTDWTLICSVDLPKKIRLDLISYTGEILKTFHPGCQGTEYCIATSPYGDIIFASKQDKTVVGYDADGREKFRNRGGDKMALVDISGLSTDKGGSIYICDRKSSKVHRLTADGDYNCEYISPLDNLSNPGAIFVEPSGKRILIAQANGKLKIFSVQRSQHFY